MQERGSNEIVKLLPKESVFTANLVIIPRRVVIHQLVSTGLGCSY